MKLLLPSLALAFACFAPVTTVFAGDEDTVKTAPVSMECCNTVCPVCDKAVDPKAKTATVVDRANSKNHDMAGAKVGFCSDACQATYMKDPSKYDAKVQAEWQKSKNKQIKGS